MFSPEQLDVLFAEVTWRATILFGASSAASLVGLTDPGGAITKDDTGHWTLTFPESQTVFLDSLHIVDVAEPTPEIHLNSLGLGTCHLHAVATGTSNAVDPSVGAKIYLVLILRNP